VDTDIATCARPQVEIATGSQAINAMLANVRPLSELHTA
jgi:hypothetical protein